MPACSLRLRGVSFSVRNVHHNRLVSESSQVIGFARTVAANGEKGTGTGLAAFFVLVVLSAMLLFDVGYDFIWIELLFFLFPISMTVL